MEDLYELLQVSKNASPEIIKQSYKTLAKKYHPDLAKDKQQSEKMMKKLNAAYEILSNPKLREEYDYNIKQDEIRQKQETNKEYNNDYRGEEYKNNSQQQYNEMNMYDNHYEQDSDYANNLNLFNRLSNLKLDRYTKLIIVIVLGIIIIFILKLFTNLGDFLMGKDNNNKNNNVTIVENGTEKEKENPEQPEIEAEQEYPIDDMTPVNLVETFLRDLKEYNFEEMNEYLTETTKITDERLDKLKKDAEVYKYIINNSEYTIKEYSVTNKKAKIIIQIDRFDVETAVFQFSLETIKNMEPLTNSERVNRLVEFLKANVGEKYSEEGTILVTNTENGWMLNFSDIIFKSLLGTYIL